MGKKTEGEHTDLKRPANQPQYMNLMWSLIKANKLNRIYDVYNLIKQ